MAKMIRLLNQCKVVPLAIIVNNLTSTVDTRTITTRESPIMYQVEGGPMVTETTQARICKTTREGSMLRQMTSNKTHIVIDEYWRIRISAH